MSKLSYNHMDMINEELTEENMRRFIISSCVQTSVDYVRSIHNEQCNIIRDYNSAIMAGKINGEFKEIPEFPSIDFLLERAQKLVNFYYENLK